MEARTCENSQRSATAARKALLTAVLGSLILYVACRHPEAVTRRGGDTAPRGQDADVTTPRPAGRSVGVAAVPYDVTRRPMELIPPGTIVGRQAPPGWTNLVIKTHPYAGAGDVDRLSQTTKELASLLFTAFLADVEPVAEGGAARYHLAKVAVGLGTKVNGRDMVLSPDTQKQFGADLGILARTVLSEAHQRQLQVRLAARGETFALVDAPSAMRREGQNRMVVLRYALFADPGTGRLDVLLWRIDLDGGAYRGPTSPVLWLPPDKVEAVVLYVDNNEFTLGIPSDRAFAMSRMPGAQAEFPWPAGLETAAAREQLTPDEARALEAGLRQLLTERAGSRERPVNRHGH